MSGLQRFLDAQDGVYPAVLAELSSGRKRTHWMWFIFPQLAGLGTSPAAAFFAMGSLEEARSYLEHPVLGPRLRECTALVAAKSTAPAAALGEVDAVKLRSSMTLFAQLEPATFQPVLDRHFGGLPDPVTLDLLTT